MHLPPAISNANFFIWLSDDLWPCVIGIFPDWNGIANFSYSDTSLYTYTVTMSFNTYTVTFFANIGNILPMVPNDCHQMSTPNTNGIKTMIGNSNFFQKSEGQNLVCMLSSYLCWSIKIKSRQKTFRFPLFFFAYFTSEGAAYLK